jgi:hypothetical protein
VVSILASAACVDPDRLKMGAGIRGNNDVRISWRDGEGCEPRKLNRVADTVSAFVVVEKAILTLLPGDAPFE